MLSTAIDFINFVTFLFVFTYSFDNPLLEGIRYTAIALYIFCILITMSVEVKFTKK